MMSSLFEETIQVKIKRAKLEKTGRNKDHIKSKLIELQSTISEIDQKKQAISDDKSYNIYISFLKNKLNATIEQIMAPTVDEFIDWINELTADKNNTNVKKLRDFLVERYSESKISASIEAVISTKNVLNSENSIFNSLLNEVTKRIRKETTNILNDPTQFENKIDDYFDKIGSTLKGLKEIPELKFIEFDQIFTDEQKANNVDFYDEFIKAIFEKGQGLKEQNDTEKSQPTISIVKNRINEIKKGISILYKSKVASDQDELLKGMFLKVYKEVNYEKGISNALNQFIDETWAEIEGNYTTIKTFFNQPFDISYEANWDTFAKKGNIISLIDEYNKIVKYNPLTTIESKSTEEAKKQLKNNSKAIIQYYEQEKQLKIQIEGELNEKLNEYGSQSKKQLLENLSTSNQDLLKIKVDIESNIEGLRGGVTKLDESENLIKFLQDDFSYVLNNLNDVSSGFELFLQKSHMEKHLAWVDTKCNGSPTGIVTVIDFNSPEIIKELLEKDLIKIEIQKKY